MVYTKAVSSICIRSSSILPSSFQPIILTTKRNQCLKGNQFAVLGFSHLHFAIYSLARLRLFSVSVYLFVAFLFSSSHRIIKYSLFDVCELWENQFWCVYRIQITDTVALRVFGVQWCKRNPYTTSVINQGLPSLSFSSFSIIVWFEATSIHLCHSLFHFNFLWFLFCLNVYFRTVSDSNRRFRLSTRVPRLNFNNFSFHCRQLSAATHAYNLLLAVTNWIRSEQKRWNNNHHTISVWCCENVVERWCVQCYH